jgi:hypothetical protein
MKNLYIILAALLTTMTFFASAQNIGDLNGIYYQAVAIDENGKEIVGKDVEGKPLYNKTIGVRFTITSGLNGPVQWEETHTTNTDKYGLFTLTIGQGQPTGSAAFNHMLDIPWIDANQFLKVEISTKNDGNYKMVSNHQFMAVPFSFYTDDIADDAITTAKILDFTILNEDVATGAVDSRTILDETILNEDIATGPLTQELFLMKQFLLKILQPVLSIQERFLIIQLSMRILPRVQLIQEQFLILQLLIWILQPVPLTQEPFLMKPFSMKILQPAPLTQELFLTSNYSQ